MIIRRSIFVTFQKEGVHKYPDAKDIEGVEFLQHPHRHMFHFRVDIEVTHNERDIEFILFKRELVNLYDNKDLDMDNRSCETIATQLIRYISLQYPNRDIVVTVSEDGENGATIFYQKDA